MDRKTILIASGAFILGALVVIAVGLLFFIMILTVTVNLVIAEE